jgi:hypothetical protein
MKRFLESSLWLIAIHVAALLIFSLYRLVEFIALHSLITHPDTSVWGAFLRGVWFDNVIGCYIMVVPLAVVLIAAIFGWSHRCLRRGVTIWFAVFYAIAFMPSAANTPYFAYFFKNINSSIFGWFGYVCYHCRNGCSKRRAYWLYIRRYTSFVTATFIWWLFRSWSTSIQSQSGSNGAASNVSREL